MTARETNRAMGGALSLALLWFLLGGSGLAAPREPVWFDLRLPAGIVDLARTLGLDPPPHRAGFVPELARRLHGLPEGRFAGNDARLRQLRLTLDALNAADGDPTAGNTVPLPLSPALWRSAILRERVPDERLFAAIAVNRRAALVAYGLAALDDDTLRALATAPDVLSRLVDRHAPIFAAFGRSLRIRDGHMQVPGGSDARRSWEALVGAPASGPARFIDALLDRDDGRLAYFYDAVAQMDEAQARFALGLWLDDDEAARAGRVKALYAAIADAYRVEWQVRVRPFSRVPADAAWLLLQTRVEVTGAPAPPASRRLWDRVFESDELPGDPARALGRFVAQDRLDAARLVELVNVDDRFERAERLAVFAFGQRVFASARPEEAPDLLVALRAVRRYPALVATIERMGATRPALYAAAARHADRLGDLEGLRAAVALREFQGALALITQVRVVRVIDTPAAERLLQSLVDLPVSDDGRYEGRVVEWLERSFVTTVSRRGIATDGVEAIVLAALAGAGTTTEGGRARAVIWEEHPYRVDVVEAELDRLRRIRTRQGGLSLNEVLEIRRISAMIAAARTPEAFAAAATRLAAFVAGVAGLPPRALPDGWPDPSKIASRALDDLKRFVGARAFTAARRLASPLADLSDALLADVLASIAYALALGDPEGRALLGRNASHLHDFGLSDTGTDRRRRTPWQHPAPALLPGQPWHVHGSLLSLDVGLSSFALRRAIADGVLQAPVLNDSDRRTFAEAVALMNAFELTDADRDAIVTALGAGRARVSAAASDADVLDALAREAGLDAWRRRTLAWIARADPAELERTFTLGELVMLGGPPRGANLAAWGTSQTSVNGCLCLRFPATPDFTSFTGRAGTGLLAARVSDLSIRVAELLADLDLPAALGRSVLAVATQAFVDEVRPADPDDWQALTYAARSLTREQFVDYISALTFDGPLIPDKVGAGKDPHP